LIYLLFFFNIKNKLVSFPSTVTIATATISCSASGTNVSLASGTCNVAGTTTKIVTVSGLFTNSFNGNRDN
jgi:hypothetical protein